MRTDLDARFLRELDDLDGYTATSEQARVIADLRIYTALERVQRMEKLAQELSDRAQVVTMHGVCRCRSSEIP